MNLNLSQITESRRLSYDRQLPTRVGFPILFVSGALSKSLERPRRLAHNKLSSSSISFLFERALRACNSFRLLPEETCCNSFEVEERASLKYIRGQEVFIPKPPPT